MQYKGYYVKITPDQSLIREAENGTEILCEGFRIEVFTDGSEKEKLDEFSAAVNYELLENSMREAEQFAKDWKDTFPAADDKEIQDTYEKISLPVRATAGSAGYDFFAPADIVLNPGETAKIPTGVRVEMEQDWVLKCYPRSGLGFKFRLQLNNTVGIIDSDYFYSDNEGHIFAKITNDSNEGKTVNIQAGTGFMQGIFVEYGITVDDEATGIRNGGFGSTTEKK